MVDLSESQYKARVVIRGQYMREGLQFNDTFAPVAKPATLRSVLAIAAKFGCILMAGDVETAFLTANMDCEVWVRLPPYWGKDDGPISLNDEYQSPCLLVKGVPGIPQGSRLFYQTFSSHLNALGFVTTSCDQCLFVNTSLKEINAVLLWVDDFIFLCEKQETWTEFIMNVRKVFNIPSAGALTTFLGMKIVRDVKLKSLTISQANSIAVLLERAGMLDSNPATSPCIAGSTFTMKDCPPTDIPIRLPMTIAVW